MSHLTKKFVFEVVTDRATEYIKKNYGELKRFVSEVYNYDK